MGASWRPGPDLWDPEQKRVVCGQAIVKEVEGRRYSPDMKLSEQ